MERTIMFRGKALNRDGANIDNDGWVYGSLWEVSQREYIIKEWNLVVKNSLPKSKGLEVAVAHNTIGQFIGVYDIQNRMIFEWDIVVVGKVKKLVGWSNHGFSVINVDEYLRAKRSQEYINWEHPHEGWWSSVKERILVIGNVFDNPELIADEYFSTKI